MAGTLGLGAVAATGLAQTQPPSPGAGEHPGHGENLMQLVGEVDHAGNGFDPMQRAYGTSR